MLVSLRWAGYSDYDANIFHISWSRIPYPETIHGRYRQLFDGRLLYKKRLGFLNTIAADHLSQAPFLDVSESIYPFPYHQVRNIICRHWIK